MIRKLRVEPTLIAEYLWPNHPGIEIVGCEWLQDESRIVLYLAGPGLPDTREIMCEMTQHGASMMPKLIAHFVGV